VLAASPAEREQRVPALVAAGKTNDELAQEWGTTPLQFVCLEALTETSERKG
jgi:hypothetical protein